MRITRVFQSSIAVLVFAGAIAPTAASAAQFGKLHLHPGTSKADDGRVSLRLYNNAPSFRDVKVGETTYTLLPHDSLNIKAPVGTSVYVESTGSGHRKGDFLFAVEADQQNKRISVN